jgi:hypothetical protein
MGVAVHTLMQTHMHTKESTTRTHIGKLQECYRSEVSALETYEMALKRVDHVDIHDKLEEILVSHAYREGRLAEEIRAAGADLPTSSGARGAFARTVQAGADLLGDRTAITMLERAEDGGVALYYAAQEASDSQTRISWKRCCRSRSRARRSAGPWRRISRGRAEPDKASDDAMNLATRPSCKPVATPSPGAAAPRRSQA